MCPLNAFSVEGKHIGRKQRAGVGKVIMVTLSARVLFYVNCFILLSTITGTMDYQMQVFYLSILVKRHASEVSEIFQNSQLSLFKQ